jgi:hypothetical protein
MHKLVASEPREKAVKPALNSSDEWWAMATNSRDVLLSWISSSIT